MTCQVIAAVVGLTLTLPTMILLFDREPPVRFYNFAIDPPIVASGQEAMLTWYGKEYRVCEGVIRRRIVDASNRIVEYAPVPVNYFQIPVTSIEHRYERPFVIPNLAPGYARYRSVVTRWCNWAQRLFWPMTEVHQFSFEVLPDENKQSRR